MPCVRSISISHALSYFDDDIKKKEAKGFDYYSQEDSGIWVGKTAERLGLTEKPFSREAYHDMMNGKFSYTNQKTGEIINIDMAKHSGHKKHQPGIELTLSAPKSLSVMSEVFNDKRVLDCHIKAVNAVLDYIQDNFIYTRSSVDGVMKLEKVDNLMAIKFTHHTNRNHDPQLHTHNLILNIIEDKNGKIKTAEFGMVFENERFIRELYNGELAHNLHEIGYNVNWTKKVVQVAPEIEGVPQELMDIFSTRRQQIEEYAKKHGLDLENPKHMEIATLATRPAKDNSLGIDELSTTWNEKIKNLGINPHEFKSEMYQKNAENINKLNIDFTESANFTITKNSKTFDISDNSNISNNINSSNILNSKNSLNNEKNVNKLNNVFNVNKVENQINKTSKFNSLSKVVNDSFLHLTERKATFSKEELISNIIERSGGRFGGVKEIEKEISKNRELVNSSIEIQEYAKHLQKFNEREKTVFTTKTQIETEKTIITNVNSGKGKFASIFNNVEIENLRDNSKNSIIEKVKETIYDLLFGDIENSGNNTKNNTYQTLNDSQKHTVEFMLKSKDQFIGIQGYAGVGKTYTIKALNEQLKDKGYTLIGLAPTNSATETLSKEANIKTDTLQSFLLKYDGYANDRDGSKIALENVKNSFKDKIILVDEASLISNKQMKDLTTIANKLNVRVLLQGDEKQLDSVEAGTPFQRLIKDKIISYSELDNILRQKNETIKQMVYDIINKDVIKAFDKLKETNSIIELRTDNQLDPELNKDNYFKDSNLEGIKKDLVEAVVNKYFSYSKEDRPNTLIITSANENRKAINKDIREGIKSENTSVGIDNKSVMIETLEIKQLTNQEKKELNNYDIGNSVVFTKANTKTGVEKNVEYTILQVYDDNRNNKEKQETTQQKTPLKQNEILIGDGNKEIIINITKNANNSNIYGKIDKELIINDQIKWTSTNKENGILKGDSLIVRDIIKKEDKTNERNEITNKEQATVVLFNPKTEKEITLNLNSNEDKNLLKHIDYNYVSTTYSSQGKTSKNVIWTIESYRPNLTSQKEAYVGLSRTKDNVTAIADNINNSMQALIKNPGEKLGALDVDKKIANNTVNNLSNTLDKNTIADNSINSSKNNSIDKIRNIELEFD